MRTDPYQARASELAIAAGKDPDGRVGEGRGMPIWCTFRDAARAEYVTPLKSLGDVPYSINIKANNIAEAANIASVKRSMDELMRVPTVRAGTIMPDACPAGSRVGEIPVGGVVATENAIHPGMHSADICCSMAISIFDDSIDPVSIIDAGMALSHFGPGGRPYSENIKPSDDLLHQFEKNRLLSMMTDAAIKHFGTQGDGNHFFFVGRVQSTGQLALVTHHGSRRPGALLYKIGMGIAEKYRQSLSPETATHNAWIPSETDDGREYWDALQIIRTWTKKSHFAIHDAVSSSLGLKIKDRFWNEHNFVFRKSDGLFYHAKGATPAWQYFASDSNGLTLIPLNMAQPILIARGLDAKNGLGFAPHGAGRNLSRTAHIRALGEKTEEELFDAEIRSAGIDARFYSGIPDTSEFPSAYKNADSVRAQISEFGLADIIDTVQPIGCIMAGEWDRNAPWKKKKPVQVETRGAQ